MNDNSRMGIAGVIAAVLLAAMVAGCRAPLSQSAQTAKPGATQPAAQSEQDGADVATPAEVTSLVAGFAEPQTSTDPGYDLLQRSDPATWFKAQLLQRVDVNAYLHSVGPQREGAATTAARALADFDSLERSKGTSPALDVLQQAEFTEGSHTQQVRDRMWLESTVARLALFEQKGQLATGTSGSAYQLKNVTVSGNQATLTYTDAAGVAVPIVFDLKREANGDLKISGWPNYAEVLGKLGPDVMGQWGD